MRNLPNPTRDWHGLEDPQLTPKRLLRVGDCSWQAIAGAHTVGEAGYPSVVANRLRDRGIAMRFDDYFVATAPVISLEMLTKVAPKKLDAIVLQMGVTHGMLELLPLGRHGLVAVRTGINWHLGPMAAPLHRRLTAPVLRRYGRPSLPPPSRDEIHTGLGTLFGWIAENHPRVPVAVLPPHNVVRAGWSSPDLVDQAARIYLSSAASFGATVLDYRGALREATAGREERFYAANGYDLTRAGHELIADALLEWLLPLWVEPTAQHPVKTEEPTPLVRGHGMEAEDDRSWAPTPGEYAVAAAQTR